VKPKNEPLGAGWLARELDRIDAARGDYVTSRWYVVEITPSKSYRRGDGHGGTEIDWTREKVVRRSAYFNLKSQAQAFLDKYEPDEGSTLKIREDKLYRTVVETWY
jgi:hypothetical protein